MHTSCSDTNWLTNVTSGLMSAGYAVVEDFLPATDVAAYRAKLYSTREKIVTAMGQKKLDDAYEAGVLRLITKFEPYFFSLFSHRPMLDVIDATVSSTAILHVQNGFILPSSATPTTNFQNTFHMDFRRYLNGYLASINILIAIDDFTENNGATVIVPGTHQKHDAPTEEYMKSHGVPVLCPAGSALIFDSTLWHSAGTNSSGKDRCAINHMFTRSFFKQQLDYVRALGDETIQKLPPRTQQILGWYTRVPTSLEEFYLPENERIYRKNQG